MSPRNMLFELNADGCMLNALLPIMTELAYTIGHSNHPTKKLLALLAMHGVSAVADVRSQPYSRFNPQFNRETLSDALQQVGIEYMYFGSELGARSTDKNCYAQGKVQYELLARTALFRTGLARLLRMTATHRVALMCAEKEPLNCHRTILVCRHLAARGLLIQHVLEDGRLESHDDVLTRLFAAVGIDQSDLFRSREELIAEAYFRRGQQIAYTEKKAAGS